MDNALHMATSNHNSFFIHENYEPVLLGRKVYLCILEVPRLKPQWFRKSSGSKVYNDI